MKPIRFSLIQIRGHSMINLGGYSRAVLGSKEHRELKVFVGAGEVLKVLNMKKEQLFGSDARQPP